MVFQAAMIAAQPLLDPQRCLIRARVSIGRHAFGVQRDFRVEMNGAFGAESKSVALERHVPRIAAVKIFAHGLGDAAADALTQGVADVDIFSRNAK